MNNLRSRAHGPLVVSDDGKLLPCSSTAPKLDWIADIQTAPNVAANINILCASMLAYDALKLVRSDKKYKLLSVEARDAVQEALTCAE